MTTQDLKELLVQAIPRTRDAWLLSLGPFGTKRANDLGSAYRGDGISEARFTFQPLDALDACSGQAFDALNASLYRACRDAQGRPFIFPLFSRL